MTRRFALDIALLAVLAPACFLAFGVAAAPSGGGKNGGPPLPIVLTFNNPAGAPALPPTWFWHVGLPLKKGMLPAGQILTAKLGGASVPVCAEQVKQESDGSAAWLKLLVNGSGIAIAPGKSASLTLTPETGTWSTTTTRTNADWIALADQVQLTNLTRIIHEGEGVIG